MSHQNQDDDDFRTRAHQIVDWLADYLENVADKNIQPGTTPGAVRNALPTTPPEEPESFDTIFSDFSELIMPNMVHWNHPGFFGYFPANHSPPSILAEMLVAGLGAQCMSWNTSPAATELEQVMMQWLSDLMDLPEGFTGVIQDTASTSTLVALLSAREQITQHQYGMYGASADDAENLTVYASWHAHSSIDKGVKLAGYGLERLRHVPVDDFHAMRPDALERMIEDDIAAGLKPACVIATIGTTSSTAVDPIVEIGRICQKHGIWLHVDAAYAGVCGMLPELSHHFEGLSFADSYVFNPHKWLFINFDCSAYYVKDPKHLVRTFQMNPEYLKNSHDEEVVNFRDWGIQLGRRFRALKIWFVLRSYGAKQLRAILRRHLRLANEFAEWVEDHDRLQLVTPAAFALVCFRATADTAEEMDRLNRKLLKSLNAKGDVFLTHTRLDGFYTIRVSIGQLYTDREDLARLKRYIDDALIKIDANHTPKLPG